nr:MAG TPA_asm: hypothetical protein [Caudoviricetes sp.]
MAKDDINVIMYKILKYFYTCMKAGVKPVPEEMIDFLDIPELYGKTVMHGLHEKGFIDRAGITIDGMRFMDSDSGMNEVDEFLGESFGIVLDNSIALQK